MVIRTASCSCGQLRLVCAGAPVRVSICHCLECQRRTGSIFAVQARFHRTQLTVSGESGNWHRRGESGGVARFHFCPVCAATVFWEPETMPDLVLVAVGAFADPDFPAPGVAVYEARRHPWAMALGALPMEHWD